ncbi:MAG TPA: TylF/MycF/NovP-related O-methyltransferase [Verrucomicrobiae bacterium]|nr:TylF/MycF/NovP-related O-methyltransferase [Verrucomicrobiae bacterium]
MRDRGFSFSRRVPSREDVFAAIIDRVKDKRVLYLEFGVANGKSMQYWSRNLKHPEAMLHGFDSFEGLPEGGGPWVKGQFSSNGKIPQIQDSRVRFFKGWFDEVLPTYHVPDHDALVINMDADIYSSTLYVLQHLRRYIVPGTFLYFDEMNHVEHEPRAFDDFVSKSGLNFRPVSADTTLAFVAFECANRRPSAQGLEPGFVEQNAVYAR